MRILSMFDCSLDNIKDNLRLVKSQGFDAVQISPLQNTKDDSSHEWWMLYQPINFNLGNRIGSKDSLRSLCDEAKKNDLLIVADVVINHFANLDDYNFLTPHPNCDPEIKNNPSCFKEQKQIHNWGSRYEVTHFCMGLPGLNPNNKLVQSKVIDMLNEYIRLGVTGFRFDAAKSIALPEEGCDFFPSITYSMSRWLPLIYGEVLFADSDLISKYAKYMKVLTTGDYYNRDAIIKYVENKDSYLSKDLSWTRGWSVDKVNHDYCYLAREYPNTLYYARNYSNDWNAWQSESVKNSNLTRVRGK